MKVPMDLFMIQKSSLSSSSSGSEKTETGDSDKYIPIKFSNYFNATLDTLKVVKHFKKKSHLKKWILLCKKEDEAPLIGRLMKILKICGHVKKNRMHLYSDLNLCGFHLFQKNEYNLKICPISISRLTTVQSIFNLIPQDKDTTELMTTTVSTVSTSTSTSTSTQKNHRGVNSKKDSRIKIEQIMLHLIYDLTMTSSEKYKAYVYDIYAVKALVTNFFKFYPKDLNRVNLCVCIEMIVPITVHYNSNFDTNTPLRIFMEEIGWRKLMKIETVGLSRISMIFTYDYKCTDGSEKTTTELNVDVAAALAAGRLFNNLKKNHVLLQ